MHIPSSETQTIDIKSFDQALSDALQARRYDPAQWLYIPDEYTEYRYILGTAGDHPLICVGVNPSTAEPGALDNTLKSVERIALFNGFDSFVMFNVYAQRATRPDDMDRELNERLHAENMNAFRWLLSRSPEAPTVWAAWGAVIEKRPYLKQCVADMLRLSETYGAKWVQAGTPSKKGHPHHPLYLRKDSVLYPYHWNDSETAADCPKA